MNSGCGENLDKERIEEEDIENLIIEQIEFCNIILLNKISEVTQDEAAHIKAVIRALQPKARIMECDYCDVNLSEIIDTRMFDFEDVATSATRVEKSRNPQKNRNTIIITTIIIMNMDMNMNMSMNAVAMMRDIVAAVIITTITVMEAEEYGIGTFVYFRRRPFNFEKFDRFVNLDWPANVIRTKGSAVFQPQPRHVPAFRAGGHTEKPQRKPATGMPQLRKRN